MVFEVIVERYKKAFEDAMKLFGAEASGSMKAQSEDFVVFKHKRVP